MAFGLARLMVAVVAVGAFAAPSAMGAVNTAAAHAAEDGAVQTPTLQRRLNRHTLAVSAAHSKAAAATATDNPYDVGKWGPVAPWPIVAIHAALLPNGKVLAYASVGDNATESYPVQDHSQATVWNPVTGAQTPVDESGFNIFCSGLAHLFDGRLFIAGGNADQSLDGLDQTHVFDPASNTWSVGPQMAAGRWYPTVTPLRNGQMLITSGRNVTSTNNTPEVYTPGSNSLRELDGATVTLPLYPWIDVAPDGKPFYLGPDQFMKLFDTTATGAWTYVGDRDSINRDYGGHALYDIGKELVAGGGPSTPDAEVVDVNRAMPTVTPTAPMAYGRRQFNLTTLADGTVLATGGNSSGAFLVDLNAGVYNAEQWNPASGQWRTLAAEQVTRQYHSTALLLPDGRILSAGGGVCGTCDQVGYLGKNAQIFSPPYLFQPDGTPAARPAIASAPASTTYGARFHIGTADPGSIKKVALVRLGAVTHSNNMDQRYVPLSFTAGATVTATAPPNANVAPPGVYMLFIIDSHGVPSVARMVGVGNAPLDVTPPTVSTVTPTGAATDVPAGAVVTATFSEPLNGPTVTRGSFVLRDPDGNPVAATVSASGSTVTLRPNVRLPGRTSYTATLAGGSGGIEDLAGNSLGSDYTWSFTTGDADPPTAASTFPASSAAYSAAGWTAGCASAGFCGTASDGDSGVQRVELSILRVGTNRYWNGTSFGSVTEHWLVASGTTSWSYAFPTLPAEGAYTVRVRAIDNAANQSTPTPTTFIYDATAPKVSVAFPLAAAAYTTPTWDVGCASPGICGTAADGGAGVSQVEVSIRRGTGSYWNGSSFGSAPEVFFTATGTTSWRFPFAGSDFGRQATYTVRVRATDGVGNVHAPTATKFTFTP